MLFFCVMKPFTLWPFFFHTKTVWVCSTKRIRLNGNHIDNDNMFTSRKKNLIGRIGRYKQQQQKKRENISLPWTWWLTAVVLILVYVSVFVQGCYYIAVLFLWLICLIIQTNISQHTHTHRRLEENIPDEKRIPMPTSQLVKERGSSFIF